jgi:2-hydroxy-6-oxonona-2,4-dienedioate hydrolase
MLMPLNEERYVEVDGLRTRYFDKGAGETILLLHGSYFGAKLSADCAANWSRNFDGLAQWGRVIALDRLGQGYTDNPRGIDDYTMAAVVDHVAQFIKTLGLRDVHLVGHSRGGYVSCRTTLDYPELVKTCVLVDSGTLAPGTTPMDALFKDAPEPLLSKESQRWVLQRYSHGYEHIDEEWVSALAAVAATEKYRKANSIVYRSPFLDHLTRQKANTFELIRARGMQKPTLVIWSFNDPTAVLERGQALFQMIAHKEPRSQMHVLNKSGHFIYREHPREFNAVLQSWIAMNN